MRPGTQVAYIPSHANGDIHHPDVEFGFVEKTTPQFVLCRFFYRQYPTLLRTVANPEACMPENLVKFHHRPQEEINTLLSNLQGKNQET